MSQQNNDPPRPPGEPPPAPPPRRQVPDLFKATAAYDPQDAPGSPALPFAAPPPPAPQAAPYPAPPPAPPAAASPWTQAQAPVPAFTPPVAAPPPAEPRARPPVVPVAVPARETIELVFYGPGVAARWRKQRAWKELLEGVEVPPEAEDVEDELPPGRRAPAKERMEVLALLTRAPAIGPEGVVAAAAAAAGEHGAFTPPLVAVMGDLEMLFEELDVLKATVAAVTPLAPSDKRLKDAVDAVHEMMKTPWLQGAPSVVEGLTAQVREAFAAQRRSLPPDYLEAHVERMLLAHRSYQRRALWGQGRLKGLLSGPSTREAVPVYLPEGIRDLPAFTRMRVRLLAEVRGQVEAGHGPWALRVVAMGRVVGK
jgi:hypothetical protein